MPKLIVKLAPSGEKFDVETDRDATITDFKALVEEKTKIPAGQQRLVFKGQILRDPRTVSSYSLTDDQTILLVQTKKETGTNSNDNPTNDGKETSEVPVTVSNSNSSNNNNSMNNNMPFNMFSGQGQGQGQIPDLNNLMNPQVMSQLLANPQMQQMMQNMATNPEMLQQMIDSNPMAQRMINSNPMLNNLLQNPQLMQSMLNPATMQAMMQMQQSLSTFQNSGLFEAFGNMQSQLPQQFQSQPAPQPQSQQSQSQQSQQSQPERQANQEQNQSSQGQAQAQAPQEIYQQQLVQMREMGFQDTDACLRALIATGGNLQGAIDYLLTRSS